jgi:hypothetical protein
MSVSDAVVLTHNAVEEDTETDVHSGMQDMIQPANVGRRSECSDTTHDP